MYSTQTYDVIKNRTLSNIDLDVYKGEGSFLNDMVSPINTELAKFYIELSYLHKKFLSRIILTISWISG